MSHFTVLQNLCYCSSKLSCWISSVNWCHQTFHLADGLYHVIYRKCHLPMLNVTDSHGTKMSTIDCEAFVFRPNCSSKLTLNHGDFVSNPDMNYCETHHELFVAGVKVTHRCKNSLSPCHRLVPSSTYNFAARYASVSLLVSSWN